MPRMSLKNYIMWDMYSAEIRNKYLSSLLWNIPLYKVKYTFEFEGDRYTVYPTKETFHFLRGFVKKDGCGNIVTSREEIPLQFLAYTDFDIIYDIGAHYGLYTVLLGKLHERTPIHIFEPCPKNVAKNIRLTAKNDVYPIVSDTAVSTQSKTDTKINLSTSDQGHSIENIRRQQNSMLIDTIDISNLFKDDMHKKYFLKLDVEGHEFSIIKHLLKNPPEKEIHFLIEAHEDKFKEDITIFQLEDLFDVFFDEWIFIKETTKSHPTDKYNRPMYWGKYDG